VPTSVKRKHQKIEIKIERVINLLIFIYRCLKEKFMGSNPINGMVLRKIFLSHYPITVVSIYKNDMEKVRIEKN